MTIADEIRQDIAQDLHDNVGQELTGLGLMAATLAEMLPPAETPAGKLAAALWPPWTARTTRSAGFLGECCRSSWRRGCWPAHWSNLPLRHPQALGFKCEFTCSQPDPVFDSRVSMHLYRIAQEAVANALRHSGAHSIRITLAGENGEITLGIEDDGTGPPSEAAQAGGMGLRTMRYRAGLIGGKLEIGSSPGGGTQVVCRCGYPPPPPKAWKSKSKRRRSSWLPKS